MHANMIRFCCAVILSITCLTIRPSHAIEIHELTTPKGFKVWFTPDKSVPLIAVSFSFQNAGSAQNSKGLEGMVQLTTAMLQEGAGSYGANAFKDRQSTLGTTISFMADHDRINGSFVTTLRLKAESVSLWQDVLYRPRFASERLELLKTRLRPQLLEQAKQPNYQLGQHANKQLFGDHSYHKDLAPTLASLDTITIDHLKTVHKTYFAKSNIIISVCGHATSQEVMDLVDQVFGDLPDNATTTPTPKAPLTLNTKTHVLSYDIPQTQGTAFLEGLPVSHKDFWKLKLAVSIFGQGFKGRLLEEIRTKKGLVYGIFMNQKHYDHAALLVTGFGTDNTKVQETLNSLDQTLKHFAAKGITAQELKEAKQTAIGHYILGLSSTRAIANVLNGLQEMGFPMTYINNRTRMINAITLDQMNTFIHEFFTGKTMTTFLVGQPKLTQDFVTLDAPKIPVKTPPPIAEKLLPKPKPKVKTLGA